MSTLSVTTIDTANSSTDLTIRTGNVAGPSIVMYANGAGSTITNLIPTANSTVEGLAPQWPYATANTTTGGISELATASEYRSDTAGAKALTPEFVWDSMVEVGLSDGANIAVDMSTGFDFSVTLAGSRTLDNPTNTKVGQKGRFRITQDGTGSRTLAFGSNYEFAGGTVVSLTTTASADDILYYDVISSTRIIITSVLDIS